MKSKSLDTKYLFALTILLIITGCAKVQAPSGGPEDKSPPEIISVTPATGSVNIPLDTELEVIFSKNMNKTVTEKAVFISPLFFDYPEYSWSGKKLKIKLPEMLKPNTTHVLTIGAAAQDNRGNRLGQSISIAFSTGETIFNGSIFGKVLSTDTRKLNIWAYRLASDNPDTFWMKLPDYVTQPDSFGAFRFEYLSYGDYLVVAVDDKNSDQFWAPPGEKLALPDTLITLSENKEEYGPLLMMPIERDTLQPYISGIVSPDSRTIRVDFSQQMDPVRVLLDENYKISHSTDSLVTIAIERIYPVSDECRAVFIRGLNINPGAKYKLTANNLRSIFDIQADTLSKLFDAGDVDTLGPELISIFPQPGRQPRPIGFDIKLLFSELLDTSITASKISITDTLDNSITYESVWQYPNQLIIKPAFQDNDVYRLSYDAAKITDLAGNPAGDTIITYYYYTASPDSFGQITGQVANSPGLEIVVSAKPQTGDLSTVMADDNGFFLFDRLFPGPYILSAFCDNNNNGRFDGGRIRPFEYAEPIAIYADTVDVRARWETDIGNLDFNPNSK